MTKWEPADEPVQIGRWLADPRADELRSDGQVVKVEPLKMRLLLALAERPGEVLLSGELLDKVWGDIVVTPSSVYQGIAQLRRLLGDSAERPEYIETVPRKGYRLVAPVVARPAVALAVADPERERSESAFPAEPRAEPPGGRSDGTPDRRRRIVVGATAVGIATVAAGVAAWRWPRVAPPALPVRIAVLPFVDQTSAASEAALAQALALDVIRAFERYPDVRVTSPESAIAVGAEPIADVARRLGVGFVLLGELARPGNRLRVNVRLLEASSGIVRWSKGYERQVEGLSLLPAVIAGEAATALHLPPAAHSASAPQGTGAYELYALGNQARLTKTPDGVLKARGFYERGIEMDPAYARNYVGMGWTWLDQSSQGGGIDVREAVSRATPMFDKALRLEPELAEALTGQGMVMMHALQFDKARELLERAIALNPGEAQAHHALGVVEFNDGWPQRAIPRFERAAELNPLSASPLDRLGLALVTSGRPGDAEPIYRRAITLEPARPNAYWGLGIKGYAEGALDAAVLGYREALARESRRPYVWSELSYLYLDLGVPALAADAMVHADSLLPTSNWPKIMASYAWLIEPTRRPPPPALTLSPASVPEDFYAVDVMMVRAMAGLPIDEALLRRALDIERGRNNSLEPILWIAFQGFDSQLDLASLHAMLGQPERARPLLEQVDLRLDRYLRQGNIWHAIPFHRSRLQALRGQHDASLASLEEAVRLGCRRGWRLRLDPAFAPLREAPRFRAIVARIDAETARQRTALKL